MVPYTEKGGHVISFQQEYNMQSGGSNKRKSPHHHTNKTLRHNDNLKRKTKQGPPSNTNTTTLPKATDYRPCRFLTCAAKLADKNALVILLPKKDTHSCLTQDGDEREREEYSENRLGKKDKSKKKKKTSGTKSFTTCHLPTVDDSTSSADWIIISPQDAITQTNQNIYRHIEIHVKPLLVLDVNGILCHRVRVSEPPTPLLLLKSMYLDRDMNFQSLYRKHIGRIAQTDIIPRTDLEEFLDYLIEHYNLALWSSAKKKTVKRLIHLMFPQRIQERLIFVWGQEKCERLTLQEKDTAGDNSDGGGDHMEAKDDGPKVIFMKHLSKVWNEFPLWNSSNTLLVDDSPEKCVTNKGNSIHPPPIMGLNVDALARYMESLQVTDDMNGTKINMDVMCFSDEVNQKKQFQFFQDLTAAWRNPSDEGEGFLMNFLNNNGRCHMNWSA